MVEENSGLKKKLDKAKRMEYLGASDEILVEEVKMYKVGDVKVFQNSDLWNTAIGLLLTLLD